MSRFNYQFTENTKNEKPVKPYHGTEISKIQMKQNSRK